MAREYRFDVGDFVTVKHDLCIGKYEDGCNVLPGMLKYAGSDTVIEDRFMSQNRVPRYCVRCDDNYWVWTEDMFEESVPAELGEVTADDFEALF